MPKKTVVAESPEIILSEPTLYYFEFDRSLTLTSSTDAVDDYGDSIASRDDSLYSVLTSFFNENWADVNALAEMERVSLWTLTEIAKCRVKKTE